MENVKSIEPLLEFLRKVNNPRTLAVSPIQNNFNSQSVQFPVNFFYHQSCAFYPPPLNLFNTLGFTSFNSNILTQQLLPQFYQYPQFLGNSLLPQGQTSFGVAQPISTEHDQKLIEFSNNVKINTVQYTPLQKQKAEPNISFDLERSKCEEKLVFEENNSADKIIFLKPPKSLLNNSIFLMTKMLKLSNIVISDLEFVLTQKTADEFLLLIFSILNFCREQQNLMEFLQPSHIAFKSLVYLVFLFSGCHSKGFQFTEQLASANLGSILFNVLFLFLLLFERRVLFASLARDLSQINELLANINSLKFLLLEHVKIKLDSMLTVFKYNFDILWLKICSFFSQEDTFVSEANILARGFFEFIQSSWIRQIGEPEHYICDRIFFTPELLLSRHKESNDFVYKSELLEVLDSKYVDGMIEQLEVAASGNAKKFDKLKKVRKK